MSAGFTKYLAISCLVGSAALAVASFGFAQGSSQGAASNVPWPPASPVQPAAQIVAMIPLPLRPPPSGERAAIPQPAVARILPPIAADPAIAELRAAMVREVPGLLTISPARRQRLLQLAQATLSTNDTSFIERPQAMLVVDRSPRAQEIWLMVARPKSADWDVIGGTKVSTGTTGRFDHYITPLGMFLNSADILGYRAEGTYNENHIRGNGVRGMRVWDFGWQWAEKGWRADRERGQIRLEMHATDPTNLAHLIGHTASSGCIRIPDALNRFLDRHGVIDADDERAAADDVRFRALLLPNRVPTPLAGNTLIVVDSS